MLGALIGLALGAIWALAGFGYMLLAGLLAAAGYVVGLILRGDVDLNEWINR
jgi:hypothetical protein